MDHSIVNHGREYMVDPNYIRYSNDDIQHYPIIIDTYNTNKFYNNNTASRNTIVAILNSYPNSKSQRLGGVKVDKNTIVSLGQRLGWRVLILEEVTDKTDILDTIVKYKPSVIWMCGHGIFERGENDFILDGFFVQNQKRELHKSKFTVNNEDMKNIIVTSRSETNVQFVVLDFCESESLATVKYKYVVKQDTNGNVDGEYIINPLFQELPESSVIVDRNDIIIIITAASNNTLSSDSLTSGGELTIFINDLLCHYGYISINLLNKERVRLNRPYHISSNIPYPQNIKFLC